MEFTVLCAASSALEMPVQNHNRERCGGARYGFVFDPETSQQLLHVTILTQSSSIQQASVGAKRPLTIVESSERLRETQ